MTLQEFLEYQRKECERERAKYRNNYNDYTNKEIETKLEHDETKSIIVDSHNPETL